MKATFLAGARSFLFVPATQPERLAKALASGADAVVLDLEDAVAPAEKPAARRRLAEAWESLAGDAAARIALRINATGSPEGEADRVLLATLAPRGLNHVMSAKSESAEHVAMLLQVPGVAFVLPLIESAEGLHALDALACAPGVLRLVFGHLDFQLDLGMRCGPEERELDAVRLQFVQASRRAHLAPPVDGVTVELDDTERLLADARRARRMGFRAKLCIHPRQVEAVNAAFTPSEEERDWARRLLEEMKGCDGGAFRFEGRMVDAPVIEMARRTCRDYASSTPHSR